MRAKVLRMRWVSLILVMMLLGAKPSNIDSSAAVLLHGTADSSAAVTACRTLLPRLRGVKSPARNAAFAAMAQYIKSPSAPTRARVRCARYLENLAMFSRSSYAGEAIDVILSVLHDDPSPVMRAGAAAALWGASVPRAGRALLNSASSDRDDAVREAAFKNLLWPMTADVAVNHNAAIYDAAIERALRSADSRDVSGALAAVTYNAERALPILRRYALDPRPAVRTGAILAFGRLGKRSIAIDDFLESRLADSDASVRTAVLFELADIDDVWAIPTVKRIAVNAPQGAERAQAHETLRLLDFDVRHKNYLPLKKYP